MIDHDVQPGPLHRCQVCGSSDLHEIIDLGHQPLCDALLDAEGLRQPEITYPLRLMQCRACTLAQLDYVVEGEEVYPHSYPYRAGLSWPVVEAHRAMAADLVQRYGRGLVLDVGCNDGTLLKQFKNLGCPVVGVEPTDVALFAEQDGIEVFRAGFDEQIAALINEPVDIITFTNVFAHMANLGTVMRGVCRALAPQTGVLVIENHYLLDILEKNQFDSIYHEHIRTYTLTSLICLFEQYGLEVFEAERKPRYGGNIRVHVGWKGQHAISDSVVSLMALESHARIISAHTWADFRNRVYANRHSFWTKLAPWFAIDGVVACSAPGRASTLLNFYNLSAREISYTGELAGSLKIGKFLPGSHIPVVSNRQILEDQPPVVVLLAWHYGREIAERLRKEGVRADLIMPLPFVSKM